MMLKFLIVTVLLIGFAHLDDREFVLIPKAYTERIQAAFDKCSDPTDNAQELLETIDEGKYRDNQRYRELISCTLRNSGLAFDDGRIDVDTVTEISPDNEKFVLAVKSCDIAGPNKVETTFLFIKCFHEDSPVTVRFES